MELCQNRTPLGARTLAEIKITTREYFDSKSKFMVTTLMPKLGMRDKAGEDLSAGDTVQVVNGANSGKVLYKIRAAGKPYAIVGDLSKEPAKSETIEVLSKKVRKID